MAEHPPDLRDEIRATRNDRPDLSAISNYLATDVRGELARRESDDRSWMARAIVRGFLSAIAAIFLMIVARAVVPGRWDEALSIAIDVFKTLVLPVVMLVFGFYFGRSDRR